MIVTTSSIRRPIISKKKLQEKKEFLLHLSFIFGILLFFFNFILFIIIYFLLNYFIFIIKIEGLMD